jgi:hypothetical protein
MKEEAKLRALKISLRAWGIVAIFLFSALSIGFFVQTPLLAENGGSLNWLIWNNVHSHGEPAYVPPMLFIIYIVWGVFALVAANKPYQYLSFLNFTMWTNFGHALLMMGQVFTDWDRYWSKFFTDIPYILFIGIIILVFRPSGAERQPASTAVARSLDKFEKSYPA